MPKCDFNNKLLCNFIEITLQHGSSLVNLLHIFRTPFSRTPMKGCLYCMNKILEPPLTHEIYDQEEKTDFLSCWITFFI